MGFADTIRKKKEDYDNYRIKRDEKRIEILKKIAAKEKQRAEVRSEKSKIRTQIIKSKSKGKMPILSKDRKKRLKQVGKVLGGGAKITAKGLNSIAKQQKKQYSRQSPRRRKRRNSRSIDNGDVFGNNPFFK